MQELQAIEALEYIEANLVLPRRVILSHIAVGINSNIEEEKTKWKLITLYQVTKSLLGKGYGPTMTTQAVTSQLYPGIEGRMESVTTLIEQEKYDHQILLEIALKAIEKLQKKNTLKNKSL